MKKARMILLVMVGLFSLVLPGYGADTLVKVSDHVYSYLDRDGRAASSYGANAGIVIGDKGMVVIDSLISAKAAESFSQAIKAVTDKPVLYVVNTHSHLDHAFGNSFFKDLGAILISQEHSDAELREKGPSVLAGIEQYGLTPEDMTGTRVEPADIVFDRRMILDLGGVTVEFLHQFPSHTPGSIMVHVPGDKVVFAGDILFTDFHPYMADGDMARWVKTLDALAALKAEKIIPGHGPLSGSRDLKEMKEYLVRFDSLAGEMAAKHYTIEKTEEELKKALPGRSRSEWLIGANLRGLYYKEKTVNSK